MYLIPHHKLHAFFSVVLQAVHVSGKGNELTKLLVLSHSTHDVEFKTRKNLNYNLRAFEISLFIL
jgi:hypothetical protein